MPSRIVEIPLGVVAQLINCEKIRFLTGLASDGSLLEDFAMNIRVKLAYTIAVVIGH
ncbi:hypothetical protein [Nostoc sp. NMS4]|uniref:hypothetical protein n=1 Tax=Nostoc sp. NMS4 TaxID=2815390 RepID=UPI0025F9FDE2|nr:hypothetical protein [Nostoc sp. NMS4]